MEIERYKIAILGGGAAGLFAAYELLRGDNAFSGRDIALIERNDRVGKKLLATGNGQCNVTNKNVSAEHYHGDVSFINSFINNFHRIDLIEYLKNVGIYLTFDEAGRGYPVSRQASFVLDAIRSFITFKNTVVKTDFTVSAIEKTDGGYFVISAVGKLFAEKIIFACGGASGENFGTDGTSYALLKPFGHTVGALYPSLTQIKTEREKIKGLKNLKERVKASLIVRGKKAAEFIGDVIFTDYGISGNAAFYLSAYVGGEKDATVSLEFLPDYGENELVKIISERADKPFIKDCGVYAGLINKRVGFAVYKTAKKSDPESLAHALKNFDLKVEGLLGLKSAQVTKGGFSTDLIDKVSYESKNARGLYVVGEALNIDGDCGGYNLTFAITTGIIAALSVKKRENSTDLAKILKNG